MREICVELPRVAVTGKEGDQPVEYLLNSNSTVTLSLLHEDFPGVTGLRYLNKANNRSRKVHCDRETCNPGPKPCSHTCLAEDFNSMYYNSGTKPTIAHEKFIVTGQPATSTSPVSRLTQSQEKVWLIKKEEKKELIVYI